MTEGTIEPPAGSQGSDSGSQGHGGDISTLWSRTPRSIYRAAGPPEPRTRTLSKACRHRPSRSSSPAANPHHWLPWNALWQGANPDARRRPGRRVATGLERSRRPGAGARRPYAGAHLPGDRRRRHHRALSTRPGAGWPVARRGGNTGATSGRARRPPNRCRPARIGPGQPPPRRDNFNTCSNGVPPTSGVQGNQVDHSVTLHGRRPAAASGRLGRRRGQITTLLLP